MTNPTNRLIRSSTDLPPNHWIARQLPAGTPLRSYAEDEAISVLTSAVQDALDASGVSRAEVAQLLGTTRSYVSQVLNGSTNMTLRTLGALLWAAGRQVTALESDELGAEPQPENWCAVADDAHGAFLIHGSTQTWERISATGTAVSGLQQRWHDAAVHSNYAVN